MKNSAVFLDRDGTINEQMGYVNHLSRFHLLPGVVHAIRLLNEAAIPVFVVTNQSGLARGYFPEALLEEVHVAMTERLKAGGAKLDGVYVCPHHPEAKEERYRLDCSCRKPRPGLFLQAAAEHDLDLSQSYVVGDRWSDVKAAAACGAQGVLVLTGYGRGDYEFIGPRQAIQPSHVADDLLVAVQWIIKDMLGRR
jgi:D-glycero-D-manno-heptose 1,7-bisphosphate phosphatase